MISFTARSILTSVDLIFGAMIGDHAVAAIGLVVPLEFSFIACWVGLSASLTSHLSRAMGERHAGRLEQLMRACRRLIAVLGAVFLGLATAVYLGAEHIGIKDPEVARAFGIYGSIVLAGAAVVGFWSVLPDSLVKAHHDMKTTMLAGLASGLTNLGLNALFVLGFGWGIWGIALATGLGRVGGFLLATWRVRHLEAARKQAWAASGSGPRAATRAATDPLTPEGLYARPHHALLALAVPSSLTFILMAMESGFVNFVLNQFQDSESALAAFAIYRRAVMLLMMPVVAIGVAVLPFAAKLVGEGRVGDVRRGMRQAHLFALGYALLAVFPVCAAAGPAIAGWLGNQPETVELAGFAIRWAVPFGVLVASPFLLCRPAFEAVQRGTPGLVMAVLRYVVLSIPLGLSGAWLAVQWGHEPFHGLVAGLISGTVVVSAIFVTWLFRMLGQLERSSS
jgi:Na+-driven multidrug efflux pump